MSNRERFLYETLDVLREFGNIRTVPPFIESGLASHIELREYQQEALENFVTYMETPQLRKNKMTQLLFHSATGSGKTVLMATIILYMYTKGYNRILFFVDQNTIVEKTKDNFLNPESNKYLFQENLEILGNNVPIKEVANFSSVDEKAINICFSTVQSLRNVILSPKENELSLRDFEENKILMIADEAHHMNSDTKRMNNDEKIAVLSWEEAVMRMFHSNRENVLLDFTATANLKDPNIKDKYLDKLVFDYPLSKFRASGYTKDFDNLQTDYDIWERTLIALILSEYRRYLFADYKQNVKPVVLFKSKTIAESTSFYNAFFRKLKHLSEDTIKSLEKTDSELLKRALDYFKEKNSNYYFLVESMKLSFQEENTIIMNSKNDIIKEKELAVNSLEDKRNPYRLIFTVDMLNEGWDVLNLYDIVRLFETRSSKNATVKEAQLIGRGARYYPFTIEADQDAGVRKYDHDFDNPNRILETMLYHSKQDSKYISELRQALKETGLLPDKVIEREYVVKEGFKESSFYKEGKLFINRKVPKDRREVKTIDGKIRNLRKRISVSMGRSSLVNLFDDNRVSNSSRRASSIPPQTFVMKEIPLHILYAGVESYDALSFSKLKDKFPHLTSMKHFLTSDDYLGKVGIIIEGVEGNVSAAQLFEAVRQTMLDVAVYVSGLKGEFEGTREFEEKPVREVVRNKTIRISEVKGEGHGAPQSGITGDLALNLSDKDWYVYNENYGTDQEKAFVKYFHEIYENLKDKYDDIYLVRNERIAELATYTFDTGERFEADFLLFMRMDKSEGYIQQQIFIEPKGAQLADADAWKEEFLKEIHVNSTASTVYKDDNDYLIYGLPFFNSESQNEEFTQELQKLILN